ncbi:DUF397 domain-containing protein [Saccharopolyspora shandongensis]|uniref:DUF397 domain-containing protein n=1 Tax=Saccharopolyspora shandongensis TaxID=418495 RepID=UPI0033CF89CC
MSWPCVPTRWQKSSYSGNQTNCVEVCEMSEVENWRKSSQSSTGNACVEVGELSGGAAVRDSKDRDGGYFVTDRAQWSAFIAAVKDGRFER